MKSIAHFYILCLIVVLSFYIVSERLKGFVVSMLRVYGRGVVEVRRLGLLLLSSFSISHKSYDGHSLIVLHYDRIKVLRLFARGLCRWLFRHSFTTRASE